jgi:hypothetical protein
MKKRNWTKIVFVLILTSTCIIGAHAQHYAGIKAGMGNFNISGADTYGGMNYKSSTSFGGIYGFKFQTDLALQVELLYTTKGSSQQWTRIDHYSFTRFDTIKGNRDETFKFNNQYDISYLEVPILLKKSFSIKLGGVMPYKRTISKIDIDVFLGPYVAYMMGSNIKFSTSFESLTQVSGENDIRLSGSPDSLNSAGMGGYTVSATDTSFFGTAAFQTRAKQLYNDELANRSGDDLSKLDIGFVFGGGFSIELNHKSKVTFDIRSTMGLFTIDNTYFNDIEYEFSPGANPGNIEEYNVTENRTKMDLKNKGIAFYLGYFIFL